MLGVHGPHPTSVIDDRGRMRQHFGDVHAALSVLAELECGSEQFVLVVRLMDLDSIGVRLPGALGEFRLRVEEVHLARAAVLHELNNGLCLRGEMDWPRGRRSL